MSPRGPIAGCLAVSVIAACTPLKPDLGPRQRDGTVDAPDVVDATAMRDLPTERGAADVTGDARLDAGSDVGRDAGADAAMFDRLVPRDVALDVSDGAVVDGTGPADVADVAIDGGGRCDGSTSTLCSGACVDLARDPRNCGSCGFLCATGLLCSDGRCEADVVAEVRAGGYFTCARKRSGSVFCWGANTLGQLGDGTTDGSVTPVRVQGLADAVQLSVGASHACALRAGGTVVCWGANGSGQVGDGTLTDARAPVDVGLSEVAAVRAGGAFVSLTALARRQGFSCAMHTSGVVRCWGYNTDAQLGEPSTTGLRTRPSLAVSVPLAPPLVPPAAGHLALGYDHACAARSGGALFCWGSNTSGQAGTGGPGGTGVLASLVVDATQVSTGDRFTCAVRRGATVACAGRNTAGQLGSGVVDAYESAPATVLTNAMVPLTGAAQVAAGGDFACALHAGGTVLCWGDGSDGALGDGTTPPMRPFAGPVVTVPTALQITAGASHACLLTTGADVYCWGRNNAGQLGVPMSLSVSATPIRVPGL